MPEFPHLKLPFKVEGRAKPGRAFSNAQPRTVQNKENRQAHGEYLQRSAADVVGFWNDLKENRPPDSLPNSNDIPVFLKVDTEVFDIDSIRLWGIDLVSEEEGGFIIGASTDNLAKFTEIVEQFLNEAGQRRDKAAQIWEVVTGEEWRIEKLLDPELFEKWEQIDDETEYTVELGVSCQSPVTKKYPSRGEFDSEEAFEEKVEAFKAHELELAIERDAKQIQRENEIEAYVGIYGGELHQIWSNEEDALYFKLSISGRGLKDLVQTYQYLFEVREGSTLAVIEQQWRGGEDIDIEIVPPSETAPKVCVIDSGIQEGHPLLVRAIDAPASRSYIHGEPSTADLVRSAGHGTKVAGAVLYPNVIPRNGLVNLVSWIQNARILDGDNLLPKNLFEPTLMERIVGDYSGTRIFNLSVGSYHAYVGTHMSPWAASIDKLTHQHDILVIICAGNIPEESAWTRNLGIREHIAAGRDYPTYLGTPGSKIANPAISLFSLTVGSIAKEDFDDSDYCSLAGKDNVSPFSRVGPGLWGTIKPDVVEFGGDYARAKASAELIVNESISPELVNSTLYGANSIGKDDCGTSYSTPKVSYIVARLQAEHPDESAQMYRALVVQSARLPQHCFENPTPEDFQRYGYGVPNVDRAVGNSEQRITFIQSGSVGPRNADIYRLKIPEVLKQDAADLRILVEVTLAFTAKTRVTRKGAHSYLSSWLEWRSSRYNEGFQSFRNRTLDYLDESADEPDYVEEGGAIRWVIRENPAWGLAGINRNNSTVQKSWAIIEPNQFADEFNLAVVGHAGWDRNLENETNYSLSVSFEALDVQMNIYEILSEAQVAIEGELEVEV